MTLPLIIVFSKFLVFGGDAGGNISWFIWVEIMQSLYSRQLFTMGFIVVCQCSLDSQYWVEKLEVIFPSLYEWRWCNLWFPSHIWTGMPSGVGGCLGL